jgi:ankyrin repeat protein
VNHLCAICPKDGRTALHKLVAAADYDDILRDILDRDQSVVNAQDLDGCSALHVACKHKRKRCVEALVALPFVDLNCRTLDGLLPDEMTDSRYFRRLIQSSRDNAPPAKWVALNERCMAHALCLSCLCSSEQRLQRFSTWRSSAAAWQSVARPSNVFGPSDLEAQMDFEKLNSRFLLLKQQPGEYSAFV